METVLQHLNRKILNSESLRTWLGQYKFLEKKIVFTNGCFDIIHPGHLHTLSSAKKLGDKLIVGLNSDDSIKRLKGEDRPIKDQAARALLLASMSFIDAIVIFEEDTPLNLIKTIQPNILVKGGDYKKEDIVGYKELLTWNGTIEVIPFVDGFSSTNYINKFKL